MDINKNDHVELNDYQMTHECDKKKSVMEKKTKFKSEIKTEYKSGQNNTQIETSEKME